MFPHHPLRHHFHHHQVEYTESIQSVPKSHEKLKKINGKYFIFFIDDYNRLSDS